MAAGPDTRKRSTELEKPEVAYGGEVVSGACGGSGTFPNLERFGFGKQFETWGSLAGLWISQDQIGDMNRHSVPRSERRLWRMYRSNRNLGLEVSCDTTDRMISEFRVPS
jgi:hypothetical protein